MCLLKSEESVAKAKGVLNKTTDAPPINPPAVSLIFVSIMVPPQARTNNTAVKHNKNATIIEHFVAYPLMYLNSDVSC